jgi:aspartate/methionine/tyrosine aminotransferase
MLSRRVPPSSEPNAWARLLAERRERRTPLVDLTEANPTRVGLVEPGEHALAALADPRGATYEPDPRGMLEARQAVARYYAERGTEVMAEDVILTSGTSESYAHLFRLLCNPEDEIMIPRPSYPLFEPLAAVEGVGVRAYRLVHDGSWHLDFASLEHAISPRVRAVFVVQPNHPTGSCLDDAEREELESFCERRGLALVSDEVFGDFPWCGNQALPSLVATRRVPTFVLSGLSKVCGLPQLKLGWIAATGPTPARAEALRGLEWIADLFLSVSTPVQLALPRLLAERHAFQARVRERLAINLGTLSECQRRHPELTLFGAQGGWVATLGLPHRYCDEEWALELLRRDVVAHPGHFYDFDAEALLVVSLIVEPRDFAAGLAQVESLLEE